MKDTPRWLQVLGVLAVGFVLGRFTIEPRADGVPSTQPRITGNDPVTVDVATEADPSPDHAQPGVDLGDKNVSGDESAVAVASSELMTADDVLPEPDPALAPYVGTWYAEVHGTRMTNLNADGTGKVHAKLDWVASLLYGSELHINVQWTVKDGVMTHTITSGTPEKNIAALTKDFGTSKDYRIEKMDEKTMTLVDPGDGEVIIWHRREDGAKLE